MRKTLLALCLIGLPGMALAQPLGRPPPAELALPGDAALIQRCEGLFGLEKTYALARKWIDAWNSNSVNRVMALYTPDFEFRARGITRSTRIGNPSGVLRGQADNRLRWFDPAAGDVKGSSQFRLVSAFAGVRSIAIYYLNSSSEPVIEVSEYAPDCKIERSNALYGVPPVGVSNAYTSPPPSQPANR